MKINEEDFDESGEDGQDGEGGGGQAGKIHFRYRDAMSLPPRDDFLPPAEIRRLLAVHKDIHKNRVEKQKTTRKDRTALKEGKLHLTSTFQQGLGYGAGNSKYKKHPISDKAQFSGIDKQVIGLPNEFDAETNLEMQEKLENRFQHRFTPSFNPVPRPRGG